MLGLRVNPSQCRYAGRIADLLADAEQCPGSEPMAIMLEGAAIGFYRIDRDARSVAGPDFPWPTVALRAFFIDAAWQRRGLGSRALDALLGDLAARHPGARRLALVVDAGNRAARRLYRRAGFVEHGALYHDAFGSAQHLLLRELP